MSPPLDPVREGEQSLLQGNVTADSLEPGECVASVLPPQSTDGDAQAELGLGGAFLSSTYTCSSTATGNRSFLRRSLTLGAASSPHVEGNATATARPRLLGRRGVARRGQGQWCRRRGRGHGRSLRRCRRLRSLACPVLAKSKGCVPEL